MSTMHDVKPAGAPVLRLAAVALAGLTTIAAAARTASALVSNDDYWPASALFCAAAAFITLMAFKARKGSEIAAMAVVSAIVAAGAGYAAFLYFAHRSSDFLAAAPLFVGGAVCAVAALVIQHRRSRDRA